MEGGGGGGEGGNVAVHLYNITQNYHKLHPLSNAYIHYLMPTPTNLCSDKATKAEQNEPTSATYLDQLLLPDQGNHLYFLLLGLWILSGVPGPTGTCLWVLVLELPEKAC